MKAILFILLLLPASLFAAGVQMVDIDIEGMSCKFCAYKIQKNLSQLPAVETAKVDIDSNKAHLVMSAGKQADIEQIKEIILESGFTPVKITLSNNE